MSGRRLLQALAVVTTSALLVAGLAPSGSAAYRTDSRITYAPNNTAFAIAVTADRVYIGGKFTKVVDLASGRAITRGGVAAFNRATGALITSFAPTVSGQVRAIAVSNDGSQVFLGGQFTAVNGQSRTNLAAVDASGSLVPGWNNPASNMVTDLLVTGSSLFVAGKFGKVNGATRSGLARIDVGSGALSSWKVTATGGKPHALAVSSDGTALVLGGTFTALAGQSHQFLGAVTLSTGAVLPWTPNPPCDTCNVLALDVSGDGVFAAMAGPGGRLSRWSWTTAARSWTIWADGDVQAVAVADGVAYAGGHYGPSFGGGPTRNMIAAVNANSGALLPWAPNLGNAVHPGVWALDAGSDYLRIAGSFTTVGGTAQKRYAELPSE